MATSLQERPSLFGKDILSRMFDKEKATHLHPETILGSNTAALTPPARTNRFVAMPSYKSRGTSRSSSIAPPSALPHTRDSSGLKIDTSKVSSATENEIEAPEQVSPSICHSPTWSVRAKSKDRSKQEAKKAAREKKELEKKIKKEEEKRKATAKPSKRLSKKPPPAMETQRMPLALGRPSESTTSRSRDPSVEFSRPSSSKDERRSSMSSLTSLRRGTPQVRSRDSSSIPTSPIYESIKKSSEVPSKVESKSSSRKASSPIHVALDFEDENTPYLTNLQEFAYQVNGDIKSAGNTPDANTPKLSPLPSPVSLQLDLTHDRSARGEATKTESLKPGPVQAKPAKIEPTKNESKKVQKDEMQFSRLSISSQSNSDLRAKGVPDNSPRGYKYPPMAKFSKEGTAQLAKLKGKFSYTFPLTQDHSAPATANLNSSGYVFKQRMHQQQKSISRYQDEVAVTEAMELDKNTVTAPLVSAASAESAEKPRQESAKATVTTKEGDSDITKTIIDLDQRKESNTSKKSETFQTSRNSDDSLAVLGVPAKSIVGSKVQSEPPPTGSHPQLHKDTISGLDVGIASATSIAKNSRGETSSETAKLVEQERGRSLHIEHNQTTPPTESPPKFELPAKSRASKVLSFPKFSRSSTEPTVVPNFSLPSTEVKDAESEEDLHGPVETTGRASIAIPSRSPLREVHKNSQNSYTAKPDASPEKASSKQQQPQVIVEGIDGDGLVRQTSIKRPRSDPQINVDAKLDSVADPKPDFNFLPQLKHQPLVKPKRTTLNGPIKVTFAPELESSTSATKEQQLPSSQFPLPASAMDFTKPADLLSMPQPPFGSPLGIRRQSAIKAGKRSSFAPAASAASPSYAPLGGSQGSQMMIPSENKPAIAGQALAAKPIAKMFVICCKCKYWHDLPSSLYEAMAMPKTISQEDGIAQSVGARNGEQQRARVAGRVFTTVSCPWCEHGMSTGCCAGWTSIVYLHERHH